MQSTIQELIDVSRYFGNNPLYIIAGGGNTSYKDDDKLWIKASGTSLAVIEEDGFVCLSRKGLKEIAAKTYSEDSTKREEEVKNDLHNAILFPKDKRPSVETSMHEIIDFPLIVHTHPTLVNALMCSVDAEELCTSIFGSDVLFVEYTDPGYILFKKVKNAIDAFIVDKGQTPRIIFLENHGVFVGGNSQEEIKNLYSDIDEKLKAFVKKELPDFSTASFHNPLLKKISEYYPGSTSMVAKSFTNELIQSYVKSNTTFKTVSIAFTPDNIVYCKAFYPFIEKCNTDEELLQKTESAIKSFVTQHGYAPKVIAIEGEGIIVVEENEKSANTVYEVFLDMLKIAFYAESFHGSKPMTANQIAFIDNWEVENYRRKVSKDS